MNKTLVCRLACVFIALGLAASLFSAVRRVMLEQSSRQCEIVLDWAEIAELAEREGLSAEQALESFLPHITGVLFKEPTVFDLQDRGQAMFFSGEQLLWGAEGEGLLPAGQIKPECSYLVFFRQEDMQRALDNLRAKAPAADHEVFSAADGAYVVATSLTERELGFGLGFDTRLMDFAVSKGLRVAVQVRGFPQPGREAIRAVLAPLAAYPLIGVGFNEREVPGAGLPAGQWAEVKGLWQEEINRLGAPVIFFELFPQTGLKELAEGVGRQMIASLAVPEKEWLNPGALGRAPLTFQRAAAERGVKMVFLHLPSLKSIEDCVDFASEVKEAIEAKGIMVGALAAHEPLRPNNALILVITLAVCAGGGLLAERFYLGRLSWPLAAAAFLSALGLLVIGQVALTQKIFALASVLIFPTLSLIHFMPREPLPLVPALRRILLTCAVSMIGAVLMTGLLADSGFMVRIHQFAGVKAAHLIPPVLTAGYFFFLADKNKTSLTKLKDTLDYKPDLKFLLLGVLVFAALRYYLLRTGNDGPTATQFELGVRNFLDQALYVRPRTKEVLIGYPFLLFIYSYGYRDVFLPFLLLAAVSQVSLVNTFAHIHTPLLISLLRAVNGLWLGIALGLLLLAGLALLLRLRRRLPPLWRQLTGGEGR
ncbi:MAG: DUF5693 family protein [Clostridiales bacterium]|nr:DUF5693 family protein [Clostridiales bacterium]